MPKSLRSIRRLILFGLVAVVMIPILLFGVWRWRLAQDVNARLAALRTAGLPTSGAELNQWYASVPDSENAALVMRQAFALTTNYSDGRSNEVASFKMPQRNQPLTVEQKKLLTGHVEMNTDALAKARETARFSKSRYPVDFTLNLEAPISHLAPLKGLAQTAQKQALLAIDAKQPGKAAVAIGNIFVMTGTLDNEPLLLSQLVRVAMVKMAGSTLERCLNADTLDEANLNALSVSFAAAEKTNVFARALVGEQAMVLPYFRMSWATINRIGEPDESNHGVEDKKQFSDKQPAPVYWSGFFERDMRYYLGVMETNIALASLPAPRNLAITNIFAGVENDAKRNFYILSSLLLPALSKAVLRETESAAWLRLAVVALAIEKFKKSEGHFPENLEDLVPKFLPDLPVDPFDGATLRYRLIEKGYLIYSVGTDGRDDGGLGKSAEQKLSDKTPFDITFTVER